MFITTIQGFEGGAGGEKRDRQRGFGFWGKGAKKNAENIYGLPRLPPQAGRTSAETLGRVLQCGLERFDTRESVRPATTLVTRLRSPRDELEAKTEKPTIAQVGPFCVALCHIWARAPGSPPPASPAAPV